MTFTNVELSKLLSVYLLEKDSLPSCAAIYFVSNSSGQVLYIGRTVNLVERWREHHRFNQLKRLNQKDHVRISWLTCPNDINTLSRLENELIALHKPVLNRTKVVSSARRITPAETALQQSLQQLAKFNAIILGFDPIVDEKLPTIYLVYPVLGRRGVSGSIRCALRNINKKASSLKWKEYRTDPKSLGKFGYWETEYKGIKIDLAPVQSLVNFIDDAICQTVAGVEMMAFSRKQLEIVLRDVPKKNIFSLDALEDDPIPLELVDKQQTNKGKSKSVIAVEPWEELEPMPEGEARLMTRQFLYVNGVEVEVCDNENGKHFVRHNVYWWIMHNSKNPNLEREAVVQNLKSFVDALPTIRWSGYRFRLETIVFSEDDVEVESILLPLTMFEDLIKDRATRSIEQSVAEEIKSGQYKMKPNDSAKVKLCAWLQHDSLNSLLETNNRQAL